MSDVLVVLGLLTFSLAFFLTSFSTIAVFGLVSTGDSSGSNIVEDIVRVFCATKLLVEKKMESLRGAGNTFFDDESEQDIFNIVDQMQMTPTPDNMDMMTASSIFGSDNLTSSSTSISTRFMNALTVNDKENVSSSQQQQLVFQEKQMAKLLNSAQKQRTSPVKPAIQRKGAAKKKNKFKPTNLIFEKEEKQNNYNHNLNMEDMGDFAFSQSDNFEM